MQRRKFSREFKLEAVKLVRERGVSVSQATRDLDLHENVLRKWVREQVAGPGSALFKRRRSKTKRRFTEEFKREAVALWETSGRMQTDVAAELRISRRC